MPIPFSENRFPENISEGATGGPKFSTDIFEATSGYEQRNSNWVKARAEYDVAHGIRDHDDMAEVIAFFYNMRGRATGFRFKDWGDYFMPRDIIGVGDGSETEFQIVKTYSIGTGPTLMEYGRPIYKPVVGTVRVWVDDSELLTGWTVGATGIITFDTPPGNELNVEVQCQFDVPVRFDIDHLPVTLEAFELESASGITLKELRPRELENA